MPIDPKLIDIDFSKQPEYTFGNKGVRPDDGKMFASFADEVRVVPESEWKELSERMKADQSGCAALVTRIYDQKQEGSCVANATAQACEITQAVQFGKDRVIPLSAISLYKRIGSSAQSGAYVPDGLKELSERGILPLDTPENRTKFSDKVMPNTGFRTPYPGDWENTANYFRSVEWLELKGTAELISALLHRFPVVVGRQGHSICYCEPVYEGNTLRVKYANSWGNWGENGYGYDSANQVKQSAGSGAFALRAVVYPDFQQEATK